MTWKPALEYLEDRTVPSTVSSIQSNFNGTAIPDGRTVWFNAVLKVSGVGADPVTIRLTNSTISSSAFNLVVPDAEITFSASTTQATTTFNDATNTWVTNVPSGLGGNTFLTGVAFQPPGGLPGGIKPIVWQASFSTDTPGVSLQWKWATAVYTQFSTDYNALGVKPVDSNNASQYLNSHHAGTPEHFTNFVVGGARGGGGSNFTGSYSGTKSVTPEVEEPPPPATASVSGLVFFDADGDGERDVDEPGIAGVLITLTNTDGVTPDVTVLTGLDGTYSFTGLAAGNYTIAESQPAGYDDGADFLGTVNGVPVGTDVGDAFIDVILASGDSGINYNFSEVTQSGGGGA